MRRAQWRESCDELRTIGSDQFEKQCFRDVLKQKEDNVARKIAQQKGWCSSSDSYVTFSADGSADVCVNSGR